MEDSDEKFKALMAERLFDIEHGLIMYARNYFEMHASCIYESEILKEHEDILEKCHIYIIGHSPKIELVGIQEIEGSLDFQFLVAGESKRVKAPIPDGMQFCEDDGYHFLSDGKGGRYFYTDQMIQEALVWEHGPLKFEVVYVGQAFGRDGERGAIDRLKKHETLQKIALTGTPEGCIIKLLLLEVEPGNMMVTAINPFAQDTAHAPERIKFGVDKLFNTSEQERVSLYEAALIRYFEPKFNTIFKNSFPSTNLALLADCYDKDFSMVVAEINFDNFPYELWSDKRPAENSVMARFDLHEEKCRKAFFSPDK